MGTGGSVTLDDVPPSPVAAGSRRRLARRHGAQPAGRGQVQRVDELQERGFLGRRVAPSDCCRAGTCLRPCELGDARELDLHERLGARCRT
jgi:hypothetical protein